MSKGKDAFAALADPTRRAILELLREEPGLAAGAIAARFPKVSRPAVSKHLAVLRRSHLVRVRQIGREWLYSVDARPLAEIYLEWLESFAPLMEESLRNLKLRIENDED